MAEKKLLQAIDDAFDPIGIRAFLESLSARGARIHDLEAASPDLTGFLSGGSYHKDDTSDTSFLTMYRALPKEAQQRVSEHYQSKVGAVPAQVKARFAKVFR